MNCSPVNEKVTSQAIQYITEAISVMRTYFKALPERNEAACMMIAISFDTHENQGKSNHHHGVANPFTIIKIKGAVFPEWNLNEHEPRQDTPANQSISKYCFAHKCVFL